MRLASRFYLLFTLFAVPALAQPQPPSGLAFGNQGQREFLARLWGGGIVGT